MDPEMQQQTQQEAQKRGYSQDEWSEILRRAEKVRGQREDSLSDRTLVESAAEVGISETDIREAQRQLEAEKKAEAQAREAVSALRRKAMAVALGVSLFVGGLGFVSYNGLNAQYQDQLRTQADLQATLQRRADVAQSAERIAGGSANTSPRLLSQLKEAENGLKSGNLKAQLDASEQLKQVITKIAAGSNGSELTRDLIAQTEGSANRVNVAQQRHNAAVAKYNSKAQSFPSSLFRFGLPGNVPSFSATVTNPGAG